jgi:low affinity Fe/Cu permease
MAKKSFLQNIEKVKSSAAMSEREEQIKSDKEKKKKLITIPVDWEDKIREFHGGTVSAYILIALQERMQKDRLL